MSVLTKTKTYKTNGTNETVTKKVPVDYNVVDLASIPAKHTSSKYDDLMDRASSMKDNEAMKVDSHGVNPKSVRSSLYFYIKKSGLNLSVSVRNDEVFLVKETK